jgi:hypothetical protein
LAVDIVQSFTFYLFIIDHFFSIMTLQDIIYKSSWTKQLYYSLQNPDEAGYLRKEGVYSVYVGHLDTWIHVQAVHQPMAHREWEN